jgi:hypothetical protein
MVLYVQSQFLSYQLKIVQNITRKCSNYSLHSKCVRVARVASLAEEMLGLLYT